MSGHNPNPNPFNPSGSQVNCFYVCCGRLLGISSDSAANLAQGMQPGGALSGEDLGIMVEACRELGLGYAYGDQFDRVPWKQQTVAIAFYRQDGSGHCLVHEKRGFMDYQVDWRGVDESNLGYYAQAGSTIKLFFWKRH